jgi:hypothetical protein
LSFSAKYHSPLLNNPPKNESGREKRPLHSDAYRIGEVLDNPGSVQ